MFLKSNLQGGCSQKQGIRAGGAPFISILRIIRQQPGKLLLPHRTAEAIDRKENLITRIVCVTPVGWMDDSEYSDDDTSQELSLDAHQPVVVQKRAVESTHTHYRAEKKRRQQ
jgi:hypothetical protein